MKRNDQLRIRTGPSSDCNDVPILQCSLLQAKFQSYGKEHADYIYTVPKNLPKSVDYIFLGQIKTKENRIACVYCEPEIFSRNTRLLTVIDPEDVSVVFLANGLLEIVITESFGLNCPFVEMCPESKFNIELVRREIIPEDCYSQRLPQDPFPAIRWYKKTKQHHFFYRVQPEDANSFEEAISNRQDTVRGPNLIFGKKKVRISVFLKEDRKYVQSLQEEDPESMRLISNKYGFSTDFLGAVRLKSCGQKIVVDKEQPKVVEIPLEFNCKITDPPKYMLWSGHIGQKDNLPIRANLFDLPPRVINTTYFQRFLIVPEISKTDAINLGRLSLKNTNTYRNYDIVCSGSQSPKSSPIYQFLDSPEKTEPIVVATKEVKKSQFRFSEVNLSRIYSPKLLDGCNKISIDLKETPKATNCSTVYDPKENQIVTISPGEQLTIRMPKERLISPNGTSEWFDWHLMSYPGFLMKGKVSSETHSTVFRFNSFVCLYTQEPAEIVLMCMDKNKKKERRFKVGLEI